MSEADKDGRIAQMIADMHACLAMSLNESQRDAQRKWADLYTDPDHRDLEPGLRFWERALVLAAALLTAVFVATMVWALLLTLGILE